MRIRSVVFATIPLLVFAGPAIASAAVKPLALPNPSWSGYSASPAKGTLNTSTATWRIPKVTCPSKGTQRAAVWVGLWGDNKSIKNGKAWLPQIGTDSQCSNGQATYFIVYQLYHGNAQFCALLPEWVFEHVCKGTKPIQVMTPEVHAGDQVQAFVRFTHKSKDGKLHFDLDLNDNSAGKWVDKYVAVDAGTDMSEVASQGGVIVEDNSEDGGLAKFNPIKLWFSDENHSKKFSVNDWQLKVGKTALATNSALKIHDLISGGTFTVTWNHAS
ncbi:MAG TPA: G1 family glutamic endopeptidase [Streptosporangiaceae bacterium]|nr:G1 family glutamic endopeptidase [Streptosporangiaceae bacterium]